MWLIFYFLGSAVFPRKQKCSISNGKIHSYLEVGLYMILDVDCDLLHSLCLRDGPDRTGKAHCSKAKKHCH